MSDKTIETLLDDANINAQTFLEEAEALSLKLIEEFRAGKEDDINVLIAILAKHFGAVSKLANIIGRSINSLTNGEISDQELLSRFTEIFMEAEPEEQSPIILLT